MKGSQEKVSIPTLVTLIKVSQFISTKGSGDMKVLQWDIATKKKIKSFDGHNGDIAALNLKPQDNQVFLTGSVDRTIRLWDLRTDSCQQTFWYCKLLSPVLLSRSAHRTPNFTNPEYLFVYFLSIFFPDKSFELISKYTQKCQYNSLY